MLFLSALPEWGVYLASWEEKLLGTVLLTSLSTSCLWFFSLRLLATKIEREQSKLQAQLRLNAELQNALDIHALVSITDSQNLIAQKNSELTPIALSNTQEAAILAAKAKSDFLATMSHEIRTPMNGVLGMLDLLNDTELSHEQSDLLKTATHSAKYLLALVNDALDLSKLEAGKTELEKIDFNLPELVEDACALMANQAHVKALELNCFIPVNLPRCWIGDPTRIRQVLTNLISNAVKFTTNGEISVSIAVLDSSDSYTGVRIEVEDTGIGIPREIESRLFQPFSQANSSTSRLFGGTGLGLSISKQLVNLMGGTIGMDSVFGQGSKFWFSLPLMSVPNASQTGFPDFSGQRVLIAVANTKNRLILEHHLSNRGFSVAQIDCTSDAQIALENAAAVGEPYHLLVADLHILQKDDYALMRTINENSVIASIPKVVLASRLTTIAEQKRMGISHCLLKPVRQIQFFDAINDALNLYRPISQTLSKRTVPFPNYANKRLLVADDNKVNLKVITSLLGRFHIVPDTVENGQEVLDRLVLRDYDLILMDCQMPIMNGYEAAKHLRDLELSHQEATHIPIIAITADITGSDRQKCLSAGMDDFLTKPIVPDALATLLSCWLGDSGMHTAADSQKIQSTSIWNEAQVLKNLDDDEELLSDMITLFIEEVPHKLIDLNKSLQKMDLVRMIEVTHSLRGMTGHFCVKTTLEICDKLENAAQKRHLVDIASLTNELTASIKILMEKLRHRKGQIHG